MADSNSPSTKESPSTKAFRLLQETADCLYYSDTTCACGGCTFILDFRDAVLDVLKWASEQAEAVSDGGECEIDFQEWLGNKKE